MAARRVHTAIFSPTGTTRKVAAAVAEGLDLEAPVLVHDLTYPPAAEKIVAAEEDVMLIGVPVYAGRVVPLAARRLQSLEGRKTAAVVMVVYGNREFDDALVELRDIAESLSFEVLAGCCFIGEHSFSSADMPIASKRPDAEDLVTAREFGKRIAQLLKSGRKNQKPPEIPGNVPYRSSVPTIPVTPKVDMDVCTLCGVCEPMCPGAAITIADTVMMDVKLCIHCCACIKICPVSALSIQAKPLLETKQWLHENCRSRKEPQLFL